MTHIHKAKRFASITLTLIFGLGLSVPAQATLKVHITGTPGSGSTAWTFSGSDTAGGSGVFDSGAEIIDGAWQDLGDFTDLNIFDVPFDAGSILGSATLTIGGSSRAIDSVLIDDDAGLGDDFAVGVAGVSDFAFSNGDTVSWTGSLAVTGIDLTDIDNTALPAVLTSSTYGDIASGTLDILDLEVTIAVIPEPTTLALAGLGLIGLACSRRRRI